MCVLICVLALTHRALFPTVCMLSLMDSWHESREIKLAHRCQLLYKQGSQASSAAPICQKKQMAAAFMQPTLKFDKETKRFKANKAGQRNARNLTSD